MAQQQQQQQQAEVIWYRAPLALFADDRVAHFIPERDTSLAERLNALLRLSIYVAAILLLFRRFAAAVYVPLGTAAVTFGIYASSASRQAKAAAEAYRDARTQGVTREGQACTVPTHDNPFMNVTLDEYGGGASRGRAPACSIEGNRTREAAESNFDHNLFRDVDDVFRRHTSSRPFYTMPNTSIPNDQTAFARWCYQTGPTCKEGNGDQCFRNVDAALPPYVGGMD